MESTALGPAISIPEQLDYSQPYDAASRSNQIPTTPINIINNNNNNNNNNTHVYPDGSVMSNHHHLHQHHHQPYPRTYHQMENNHSNNQQQHQDASCLFFLDDLSPSASTLAGSNQPQQQHGLSPNEMLGVSFGAAKSNTSNEIVEAIDATAPEFRPAGDEVGEERARELRVSVQRFSPVHVSQRERTLGEVSLTTSAATSEDLEVADTRQPAESMKELKVVLARVDDKRSSRQESEDSELGFTGDVTDADKGTDDSGSGNSNSSDKGGAANSDSVDETNSSNSNKISSNSNSNNDNENCGETKELTRLEPERPEAFTEDSAESLALAGGARDEVRSDGSDSGLGSELPNDPLCPATTPESDSETSFLDRIADDILDGDKDKGSADFVPETPKLPHSHLSGLLKITPTKSSLKRRLPLNDCMDGEPNHKRFGPQTEQQQTPQNVQDQPQQQQQQQQTQTSAQEDANAHASTSSASEDTVNPPKKKKNIHFDAVTVYYFPRAQGFTCVPSQGGSTLGMSATHTHAERFSLSEHATEQRRLHRARLSQLRSERTATSCSNSESGASSSEDPSDDTDEEPSDQEELDIDSYYFLQPVPTWQRRALLRQAGVRRIDAMEKDDCRNIRASREHCGCSCKGYCDPESCPCSRANVKCQVDRAGFPCGCSRDGCANSSGRIEFNPVRVRTHFIHTIMRLELEKKQHNNPQDHHHNNQNFHALNSTTNNHHMHNHNLHQHQQHHQQHHHQQHQQHQQQHNSLHHNPAHHHQQQQHHNHHHLQQHQHHHQQSLVDSGQDLCGLNGSQHGYSGLHYDNQGELDLYGMRDDCYPSTGQNDGQNSQRRLHTEFNQGFQHFAGGQATNMNGTFQQNSYQDYQSYQNLPSTSRSSFQSQFQTVNSNANFSHYGTYGQAEPTPNMQPYPAAHQPQPQHNMQLNYESPFTQDKVTGSQYANLTSLTPTSSSSVVQQIGKLESFSELLNGRYSYYGELEQTTPTYHPHHHGQNGTGAGDAAGTRIENCLVNNATEKADVFGADQQMSYQPPASAHQQGNVDLMEPDCDDNFGEIIKKSMVETV